MRYATAQRSQARRIRRLLSKAAGYPRCTWEGAPDVIKNWNGAGKRPPGWTMHAAHQHKHRRDTTIVLLHITRRVRLAIASSTALTPEERAELQALDIITSRPRDTDSRQTYIDEDVSDE